MKILIVRNSPNVFNGRGVKEGSFYNCQELGLAKAFHRKGIGADILYFGEFNDCIDINMDNGEIVHWYFRKGFSILKMGIFIGTKELFNQYDTIISTEYDQIQSLILAVKFPKKTIVYHGPYFDEFNKRYNIKIHLIAPIFSKIYRKRNTIFIAKSRLAKRFLQEQGIRNIYLGFVGLDVELIEKKEQNLSSDCENLLSEIIAKKKDNKILLYVGRLEERRNIGFLLKLFAEVKKEYSAVKLLIIGDGNKKYLQFSESLMKDLKIQEDIIYRKRLAQSELAYIYKEADIFLLPTKYEIFGMVLLEAMYFSIPVVTSFNGGSDILIEEGRNGEIVKNWNLDEWKNKVLKLLDKNDICEEMGKKAHHRIKDYFSWESFVDVFLKEIINKRNQKYGILTYHQAVNYGAVLQCYALQQMLFQMNVDNIVIDYKNKKINEMYSPIALPGFSENHLKSMAKMIIRFPFIVLKSKRFHNFIKDNIITSSKIVNKDELKEFANSLDGVITGSDMVWNRECNGGDSAYFLDFLSDNKNSIAYAASIGVDVKLKDYIECNLDLLGKIKRISVREKTAADILNRTIEREVKQCLDPALLLDKNQWSVISRNVHKKNYILIYEIEKEIQIYDFARKLAERERLQIKSLSFLFKKQDGVKRIRCKSPRDFLGFFESAQYIVTNSYHGVIFSIIFQKDFFIESIDGNGKKNNRVLELLDKLCISGRDITGKICNIEWNAVSCKLAQERASSQQFLKDAINDCNDYCTPSR